MKQTPDHGKSVCPTVAEPWSGGSSGGDTRLRKHGIVIERKHVTFDLRENSRGRFLRIIEEVSGRRNTIIVPLTGIEDFRDALNEVIKFSKALSPRTSFSINGLLLRCLRDERTLWGKQHLYSRIRLKEHASVAQSDT
jgi:hypothetical protein